MIGNPEWLATVNEIKCEVIVLNVKYIQNQAGQFQLA